MLCLIVRNVERYALAGNKKAYVFKRQLFKTHLSAKTWNDHIAKWASLWIYNFLFKPRLAFQAYKLSRIKMSLSPSNGIFSLICPLDRTVLPLPIASLQPERKASSCLVSSKNLRLLLLSPEGPPRSQGWKSFCMWIFLFHCPKHFCKRRRILHPIAVQMPGYPAYNTAGCPMQLGKKIWRGHIQ